MEKAPPCLSGPTALTGKRRTPGHLSALVEPLQAGKKIGKQRSMEMGLCGKLGERKEVHRGSKYLYGITEDARPRLTDSFG